METFSALLAICAGNSPVPGEFPAQRPVTRSFDVFFDLRPNKQLSKQWWGWWFETPSWSLWRHRNVWISHEPTGPQWCMYTEYPIKNAQSFVDIYHNLLLDLWGQVIYNIQWYYWHWDSVWFNCTIPVISTTCATLNYWMKCYLVKQEWHEMPKYPQLSRSVYVQRVETVKQWGPWSGLGI